MLAIFHKKTSTYVNENRNQKRKLNRPGISINIKFGYVNLAGDEFGKEKVAGLAEVDVSCCQICQFQRDWLDSFFKIGNY